MGGLLHVVQRGGDWAGPRIATRPLAKLFQCHVRPRPRWGSLQRFPDPLAGFNGAYF